MKIYDMILTKDILEDLYIKERKSINQIARLYKYLKYEKIERFGGIING